MSVDPAYALYVWGAYAASGAVLAGLTLDTLVRARRWRREAERREEGGR